MMQGEQNSDDSGSPPAVSDNEGSVDNFGGVCTL